MVWFFCPFSRRLIHSSSSSGILNKWLTSLRLLLLTLIVFLSRLSIFSSGRAFRSFSCSHLQFVILRASKLQNIFVEANSLELLTNFKYITSTHSNPLYCICCGFFCCRFGVKECGTGLFILNWWVKTEKETVLYEVVMKSIILRYIVSVW